jgi:hypothetical protein
MTTKRNIILTLILVLGTTSALYAGRGHRPGKHNNNPRGKSRPALKSVPQHNPRPASRMIVKTKPLNKRPAVRHTKPRKQVKVVYVQKPRPVVKKVVKVVRVIERVQPYCEYNDKEVFYITILNRTHRKIDLELDGSHEGDDDIGKLYPGEGMEYPMVVKSKKLPETFELEAGPHELEFTLTHHSPRNLVLVVTPHGIYAD